ncbi:hypothetical protein GCM10022243_55420 [Saccharothrix violaceirubra]|uniref:Uncharacterized protein n=1 Tax=Saccharothrix violaceirubra TaxID=413306 RepID=A0A7W7WXV6_9PSEU|nr:hypothetical protein [Saccharothrix violaceirubra]MBB4967053.1 hypothetical protein [Saccharothrix violaceirubra]
MRRTVLLGLVFVLVGLSAPAAAEVVVPGAGSGEPVTATQTFDEHYNSGGPAEGSVTVSQTADLVRQRVKVSWSGLRPTAGSGVGASYPVVVMQCWGAPADVKRENCWAAGRGMEPATFNDAQPYDPVLFGDFGDIGLNLYTVMSFTARDGKRYSWDQVEVDPATGHPVAWPDGSVLPGPPPDLSQDTYNFVLPPTLIGETRADGTGSADIELLTADQMPSVGCSDVNACSLVVVPVGDPNCVPEDQILLDEWKAGCLPHATDYSSMRDASTWKTPTNWGRRFAFPLSFRKSPQVCTADDRSETTLTGSPYLGQLMASWRPKFCLDGNLFKLGYTSLGEGDARRQFTANLRERRADGVNAVLTSRPVAAVEGAPVGHAPVAVSGFSVSFVLDDADGREVLDLKLTPRLLLKMLTQSYTGAAPGIETHPAISGNPTWWGNDPELVEVNGGLRLRDINVAPSAYPVAVQGDMDLTWALTAYIASDAEALAFLGGTPDRWGMKINPKFAAQVLPYDRFELRDDWRVPANSPTYKEQLWFNLVANQVASVVGAAVALVQARPTATTNETIDNGKLVYKRPERQQTGNRALLAITDLGDSLVFGLPSAALRSRTGEFVVPTPESLTFGVATTVLDERTGVLTIDHTRTDGRAYPGTVLVYAAVPTRGLPAGEGERYAAFLEYAAGAGQQAGVGVGQLPVGYLPLPEPLREQARVVARAVREQKGDVPPAPQSVVSNPSGRGSAVAAAARPAVAPAAPVATTSVSAQPSVVTSSARPVTSAATRVESSSAGRWLLPGLLGLGVLAGVMAPLATVVATPGHPVRRFFGGLFRR